MRNHTWKYVAPGAPQPDIEDAAQYNFAPDLDSDIVSTNTHMDAAVKEYGTWDYEALMLADLQNQFRHHQHPLALSAL